MDVHHENLHGMLMMQLMVDDLDSWWEHIAGLDLPAQFGVPAPVVARAGSEQPWSGLHCEARSALLPSAEVSMSHQTDRVLRTVLLLVGIVFIAGVWPLMMYWPAGWQWQPNQAEYEQMILGVYATLGVFLVIASRNPGEHRSLILFAGWSSLVHAGIMAVQALRDSSESGHWLGDIPVLAAVGIIFIVLAPKGVMARSAA